MKNIVFVVKGCLVVLFLIGCCAVSVLSGMGAFVIFSDPEFPETRILIISGFTSLMTLATPVAALILILTAKQENNNDNTK